MHRPIQINDLSLSFPGKRCFQNFNCHISFGSRIAIIGKNGSGKSSLLKLLNGTLDIGEESISRPNEVKTGYVPQIIDEFQNKSGSQRVNQKITEALAGDTNLLLLDEPTNHLDLQHRKSLMRMLKKFSGTLIIVTHDREVLMECVDTLWDIDNHEIHIFSGSYEEYLNERKLQQHSLEQQYARLKREKKETHYQLMKEQKRAAKSKCKGKKNIDGRKWPTITSKSKALRSVKTTDKKKLAIDKKKEKINHQLENIRQFDTIIPRFSLTSEHVHDSLLISVNNGSLYYSREKLILEKLNFIVSGKEHIALTGENASGKSTLLNAIAGSKSILTNGNWTLPGQEQIGYLDQHYCNLNPQDSVYETIAKIKHEWSSKDIRKHLNNFLFRKNEEVEIPVKFLSGGEKTRLSLSVIAAKTPRLLILDEITNNLDLETKEHVVQTLKHYPGCMIVVSHEMKFLQQLNIDKWYQIVDKTIK